jgi:hypothetical protein
MERIKEEETIQLREIEYEIQDILKMTKIFTQQYEKYKQDVHILYCRLQVTLT